MNRFLKRFLFLSAILFAGNQGHAADGMSRNWSAGILFGGASLNLDFGNKFNYGAMIRDRFNSHFAFGLTLLNTRITSASEGSASANSNIIHGNIDALYYFTDQPSSIWVGARLGIGAVSINAQSNGYTSTSTSKSYFDYGPALGGDLMILDTGSVGLDLSYMLTSFPANTLSSFQYLGTFKFHW